MSKPTAKKVELEEMEEVVPEEEEVSKKKKSSQKVNTDQFLVQRSYCSQVNNECPCQAIY